MGDSRIPLPTPPSGDAPPANPNKASLEISKALTAVIDADSEVKVAKLNLASRKKLGASPESIAIAEENLVKAEALLSEAQAAYSSLVT